MRFRRVVDKEVPMDDLPDWLLEGRPMKKQTKRRRIRKSMERMYKKTGNDLPLETMKTTYGLKCDVCGRDDKLTVHHKIPLIDGGNNHPDNIAILCGFHHMEIHDRKFVRRLR